ncbi:hypothetical protein [Cryptosporangium sp. NPDC048952]|uniref:hypothetical protein n=1 Tax=Cryptosporangium sp. NPDC048952 TaxID=3363961 RepID=UPI00371D12D0
MAELDDDHDLLTFAESDTRLNAEIAAVEASIVESGSDPGLEARLAALRAAAARNSRDAAAKPGETGFLSYTPRRPEAEAGA